MSMINVITSPLNYNFTNTVQSSKPIQLSTQKFTVRFSMKYSGILLVIDKLPVEILCPDHINLVQA